MLSPSDPPRSETTTSTELALAAAAGEAVTTAPPTMVEAPARASAPPRTPRRLTPAGLP